MKKWLGIEETKRKTEDSTNNEKYKRKSRKPNIISSTFEKNRNIYIRKYQDWYLEFGFTWNEDKADTKPLCVICSELLSNQCMKPSHLKRHLISKHEDLKDKSIHYFERKLIELKTDKKLMRSFTTINERALEASYYVSLRIAKTGNPHTIGEKLILPAAKDIVSLLFDEKTASKLDCVPLSNNTVHRRVHEMADSVKHSLIKNVKESQYFALQFDETTDITNFAQLLVYIRFNSDIDFNEEFLFCESLPSRTTANEIFQKIDGFMAENDIPWKKCVGVCTDGARALTGKHIGVVTRIKKVAPESVFTHCCIHREALVAKIMPEDLKAVLKQSVNVINFIKARALNSRIFTILCQEMGSEHEKLLLHTEVRWLSRGKVLNRLFELRSEVQVFLSDSKHEFKSCFFDELWLAKLAYLSDVFGRLNDINLSLQGPNVSVFTVSDKIEAAIKKFELIINELDKNMLGFLPTLESFVIENNLQLKDELKSNIKTHCSQLIQNFKLYFPEDYKKENWIRDPFNTDNVLLAEDLSSKEKEHLIDISCDRNLMDEFKNTSIINFWIKQKKDFKDISEKAIKFLIPFCSTYMCETGFSAMLYLKNKYRSKLDLEPNLRLKLTKIEPDIKKLVSGKQVQPSH